MGPSQRRGAEKAGWGSWILWPPLAWDWKPGYGPEAVVAL